MKSEVRALLDSFQAAYDAKDIEQVDAFMAQCFVKDSDIAIIGTSDAELCLNYDACKDLFVNDWKYWGFENLAIDKAITHELDELSIVYVPANFSFTFEDGDRQDHFNDIISLLENDSKDKRDLLVKFGEINYELMHIYHSRDGSSRKYLFDLRVTFILTGDKIKQINFSVLDNIKRPDARLYEGSHFNRYLDYELGLLRKKEITNVNVDHIIKHLLNDLFTDYFDAEKSQHYFHDDLLAFGVDDKIAKNITELKSLINTQHDYWDHLILKSEDAYIDIQNDHAIVIGRVTCLSTRTKKDYLEMTRKEILALKDNQALTVEEKMFKINQLITIAYKETSIGTQYDHPIRLHLVLSKLGEQWKIHYMQLSYSFHYLLEDRNEYMYRVK